MAALEITQDNFQKEVLETSTPVLIDFWAPWCGPCQMQGPIIDELAGEVGAKAVIGKVNVDDNIDLAQQYGIMSIPALKVFKDGQVVEDMVGVHSKDDLLALIEKHS